jgi:hypothetical protein
LIGGCPGTGGILGAIPGFSSGFWSTAAVTFDYSAFNTRTGVMGLQLFSLLPNASTAFGLKAAAAASAKAQRARDSQPIDTSGLSVKASIAERTAFNYQRLTSKLNSTVRDVTKARDTLVDLKTILSDMRRLIVLSQGDTITDDERRQHANEFDQLLGKLNIKVSSSGGLYGNLIGNSIRDIFSPEPIVYRTQPDSKATESVTGVYSGSDYTITDGDGNVYFTDRYGSNIQKFPFDDTVDPTVIASTDTVSYDSDTGAVSLTRSGESDPYLSGTLERKGLGVLHSFLYGDFTDPDKLDQALSDLDAASSKLRFNITVIESQLTKVTARRDYNKAFVQENTDLAVKINAKKSAAEQKAALEAQRQQLLYASTFQNTTSFDASGTLLSLNIQNLVDFQA